MKFLKQLFVHLCIYVCLFLKLKEILQIQEALLNRIKKIRV